MNRYTEWIDNFYEREVLNGKTQETQEKKQEKARGEKTGKHFSPSDCKPLDYDTIRKIMDGHCIPTTYYIGNLYAVESWTENGGANSRLVDVSRWSKKEIYDWLGY